MKNIEIKKGICRICGCTTNNPCYNPKEGFCWWMDNSETLCSHCDIAPVKNSEETLHRVNDLPNWKVPFFKDYNGVEYNHYGNLGPGYESRIICPCCGFHPSTDDYNSILEIGKNECKNCGSVYTVEEIHYFIIKCQKYRTDGETR